jgi:hypothetical protein
MVWLVEDPGEDAASSKTQRVVVECALVDDSEVLAPRRALDGHDDSSALMCVLLDARIESAAAIVKTSVNTTPIQL